MTELAPILESDLHAYVDRELATDRRPQVEAFLAANLEEGEKARFYQELNDGLHALFDPVLNEPVPLRLQQARAQQKSLVKRFGLILIWIALGATAGWSARAFYTGEAAERSNLARNAAIAHLVYSPEVRHPVEVGAEEEQHLVSWLSKRLGFPLEVPYLSEAGYELFGGRLLPGDRGPVAYFMYQGLSGQRLTLYIRTDIKSTPTTAFRFYEQGKVRVFYWLDGKLGYALSGEVDKDELLRVARAVYRQLHS